MTVELLYYVAPNGKAPYEEWFASLRDPSTKTFVLRRLDRVAAGNSGDCKYCREGVWELRLDKGPGYRIYYAKTEETIVVLLCAGDKSTQSKDVERAVAFLIDYSVSNGI